MTHWYDDPCPRLSPKSMKRIKIEDYKPLKARGYTKHILLDEDDLQSAGARVQIVTMQPGDIIAAHVHRATREFYRVLQGHCQLTVNDETVTLNPGDMLLMEPGDVHSLQNQGTVPFLVLVFKTNGDNDTFWAS